MQWWKVWHDSTDDYVVYKRYDLHHHFEVNKIYSILLRQTVWDMIISYNDSVRFLTRYYNTEISSSYSRILVFPKTIETDGQNICLNISISISKITLRNKLHSVVGALI